MLTNTHNKAQQADLRQLSPFVHGTAQKAPVTSGGCARRYIVFWVTVLCGNI